MFNIGNAKKFLFFALVVLLSFFTAHSAEIIAVEDLRPYMFQESISGVFDKLIPSSTYEATKANIDQYTILMERIYQQILPTIYPKTEILAYGGLTKNGVTISYPAPSIFAQYKTPVKVKWVNNVYGPHMLPVDLNPPFNSSSVFKNEIPLVPHVHGVAVEQSSDGLPQAYWTALGNKGPGYSTQETCKKNEAVFIYPNQQKHGLFWYHDHTVGMTRLNVYAGLVGLYLIESPVKSQQEKAIEKYYGELQTRFLVIADKIFKDDGSLFYSESTDCPHFSTWAPEFFGTTIVVNGKVWPKMVLKPEKYRIVLLNGCQSRYLNVFFLSNKKKLPFDLIRTEGDYFSNPVRVTEVFLSLSARIQIILDLTKVIGDVFVKNNSPAPHPQGDAKNLIDQFTGTIMKIQVPKQHLKKLTLLKNYRQFINQIKDGQKQAELGALKNVVIKQGQYPAFPEGEHVYTTINEVPDEESLQIEGMFVDGICFEKSIGCPNSKYRVGQVYDFYFINLTPDTHPMHIHLVNFQKISQIPFDVEAYEEAWFQRNGGPPSRFGYQQIPVILDPRSFFTGPAQNPKEHEKTFRDIIDLSPEYVTVVRIKFSHNDGSEFGFNVRGSSYVIHCHMLEHEDNDMMKHFCLE